MAAVEESQETATTPLVEQKQSPLGIEDSVLFEFDAKSNKPMKIVFLVILTILLSFGIYLIIAFSVEIWPFEADDDGSEFPITKEDIDVLRDELYDLFERSTDFPSNGNTGDIAPLLATTVRLVFHDCGGPPTNINASYPNNTGYNVNATSLCDGCIDSANLANHAFLKEGAIDPLEEIYESYFSNKMSRADYWATAGLLALEYASGPNGRLWPNLGFYFGRIDCEISPLGDEGNMAFPNPDGGLNDTLTWFAYHFDMTLRETVTIIGAHTLGRAHKNGSGYINRWVPASNILDNMFYIDLIDNSQMRQWQQFVVDGTFRIQWGDLNENNENMMLNSDMSLYIKIEDYLSINGSVNCVFYDDQSGLNQCPPQNRTASIVEEYAGNNVLWLTDFAAAFQKMSFTGYNKDDLYMVKSCLDEAQCNV